MVTAEGNGKSLQYSCLENPMNSMKRQKDMTLKDEHPRLVGSSYVNGEEWRRLFFFICSSYVNGEEWRDFLEKSSYVNGEEWRDFLEKSRKTEEAEPKRKQHPVVNASGDGNKV